VLDKGYDSEELHQLIRDDLNSYSLIPVRPRKRKRISGFYQRELSCSFDQTLYHRRNLAETVFSLLKRKFGESLKARNYRNQSKELKIKLILYNISKIIHAFLIYIRYEDFYRAVFFSFLLIEFRHPVPRKNSASCTGNRTFLSSNPNNWNRLI
jgi:hypothetical protein